MWGTRTEAIQFQPFYRDVKGGRTQLEPLVAYIACLGCLVARLLKIPHLLSCFLLLHSSSPPHSHILATLFIGLPLTPTANLAGSDKALKSSACVSHSGWAGPSWMRAVHRAELGAHMAGGRGKKAPSPAVVGREGQAQVAQSQHLQGGIRQ